MIGVNRQAAREISRESERCSEPRLVGLTETLKGDDVRRHDPERQPVRMVAGSHGTSDTRGRSPHHRGPSTRPFWFAKPLPLASRHSDQSAYLFCSRNGPDEAKMSLASLNAFSRSRQPEAPISWPVAPFLHGESSALQQVSIASSSSSPGARFFYKLKRPLDAGRPSQTRRARAIRCQPHPRCRLDRSATHCCGVAASAWSGRNAVA